MRKMIRSLMLPTVAVLSLSACGSECTEEELGEKLQEISTKVQNLAASGDMAKLMEFSQKASKISNLSQGDSDLQAACQAADDLLDEL